MNTFTPFTQLTSSQLLDNLDNDMSQNSSPTQPELILDTPLSQNPSDSGFAEEAQTLFNQYVLESEAFANEQTIRETPKDPRKRKANNNTEPSAPKKKPATKKQVSKKNVLFTDDSNKENKVPDQPIVDKPADMKMTLSQLITAYEEIGRFSANFGRLIVVTRDSTRRYCQLNVIKKLWDPEMETSMIMRTQSISLHQIEFERVLLAAPRFLQTGIDLKNNGWRLPDNGSDEISDKLDEATNSWHQDVMGSNANRFVRLAICVFDWNAPETSTYYRVKLFKREQADKPFIRSGMFSFTMQEMQLLSNRHGEILKKAKEDAIKFI